MSEAFQKGKIALLLILLLCCFSTFFTSNSSELGTGDLPQLRPARDFCSMFRSRWASCSNGKDQSVCQNFLKELRTCEYSVQQAFRRINMGGCPKVMLANALCQAEWCLGQGASSELCHKECSGTIKALNDCINENVNKFKRRNGVAEES